MSAQKFAYGDRVMIAADRSLHGWPNGSIVTVVKVAEEVGGGYCYECEHAETARRYWAYESDLAPLPTIKAAEPDEIVDKIFAKIMRRPYLDAFCRSVVVALPTNDPERIDVAPKAPAKPAAHVASYFHQGQGSHILIGQDLDGDAFRGHYGYVTRAGQRNLGVVLSVNRHEFFTPADKLPELITWLQRMYQDSRKPAAE